MTEEKTSPGRFLGTFFQAETIFKLAGFSKVMAWIVLAVYSLEFGLSVVVMALQIMRGFWVNMGLTDYASNIMLTLERPFRGIVYFVVLLGISETLKIFVEIEANTRRAARNISK